VNVTVENQTILLLWHIRIILNRPSAGCKAQRIFLTAELMGCAVFFFHEYERRKFK